jgi:hypothetical protein
MTKQALRVLHGYRDLTYTDKKEVREEIDRYERTSEFSEGNRKAVTEVTLGPVIEACPCCGRS